MAINNKLKPIRGRVILKLIPKKRESPSGIIIPDTVAEENSWDGKVLFIGEEELTKKGEKIPISFKVGDKVKFRGYASDEFEFDGEKYHLLKMRDILGIYE